MEEIGEPVLPRMADRLRRLLRGDQTYRARNGYDICFVYSIIRIKKWDPAEVACTTNQFVDMGDYARTVLARLDETRTDVAPAK